MSWGYYGRWNAGRAEDGGMQTSAEAELVLHVSALAFFWTERWTIRVRDGLIVDQELIHERV